MTTICLPASIRAASFSAAQTALPLDPPAKIPSSSGQSSGHEERIFIVHLNDIVDQTEINSFHQVIFTDPFHLIDVGTWQFSGFEIFVENRTFGIDSDHFGIRFPLLQVLAGSAQGAAGSDACHQIINLPFGLSPRFPVRWCGNELRYS